MKISKIEKFEVVLDNQRLYLIFDDIPKRSLFLVKYRLFEKVDNCQKCPNFQYSKKNSRKKSKKNLKILNLLKQLKIFNFSIGKAECFFNYLLKFSGVNNKDAPSLGPGTIVPTLGAFLLLTLEKIPVIINYCVKNYLISLLPTAKILQKTL